MDVYCGQGHASGVIGMKDGGGPKTMAKIHNSTTPDDGANRRRRRRHSPYNNNYLHDLLTYAT